ncbi:extradiol dioxygenase [Saccharibacillus sp. O16]|nr:extradiol dioxygenase [Saccharibacillus sp. O16]
MILGLYEAHLPVSDLDRSVDFYSKLGLELAWRKGSIVFFWIEKEKSWLGLWEGEAYKTEYHPSLRHLAFRVKYDDLKNSLTWLQDLGIEAVPFAEGDSVDPFVRPSQGNASVYFKDPDGNSLELMSFVEVPDPLRNIPNKLSFAEWERLLQENKQES